jgi:mannose-6-phosphate isomerase-like protein (cupin superfamily)
MSNRALVLAACLGASAWAADPTFLRRSLDSAPVVADDLTVDTRGASYRALFGVGDPDVKQLKSVARYGELTLDAGTASALVSYPAEEQIYFVLEGRGTLLYAARTAPLAPHDYVYLPPGVRHGVQASAAGPLRLLVLGFRIPPGTVLPPAPDVAPLANADAVPLQVLPQHGPGAQFRLLLGDAASQRDRLAVASQVASFFILDFAPGGTNIPHHHDREEEIYFVLQGSGDMVAGGGADGNEGRYVARSGDAFFIRLNATVGFYSASRDERRHDVVLAVRSRYPFGR